MDDVRIREATQDDLALIFTWTNDRETRQNSFSPGYISFETHRAWFQSKLQDEKCFFYIIEKYLKPIGTVRFDKGNETIVSVTVAPEARGKGYGSIVLRLSLSEYWRSNDDPVFAYIKPHNMRSLGAFRRIGFRFVRVDSVHGVGCHVLQCNKNETWDT